MTAPATGSAPFKAAPRFRYDSVTYNPRKDSSTMPAKKKSGPKPNRLTTPLKIRPLPGGKKLAPYHVPDPPASKFTDIPGQLTLEDMGAIELPEVGAA